MGLVNELKIRGRICTSPEQAGRGPTRFRLGRGGGGQKPDGSKWPTQFFSVVCWDTKLAPQLSKGMLIELTGKLRDASYIKDGVAKSAVEIVLETFTAVGGKTDSAEVPEEATKGGPISDEYIPF